MKAEIETQLLKLTDGARILRFAEPQTGLCLEKRLDSSSPVAQQTSRWRQTFHDLLSREFGARG